MPDFDTRNQREPRLPTRLLISASALPGGIANHPWVRSAVDLWRAMDPRRHRRAVAILHAGLPILLVGLLITLWWDPFGPEVPKYLAHQEVPKYHARELDPGDCYDFWGLSDDYFADCFEASTDDVPSKESLALITLDMITDTDIGIAR